MFPFFKSGLRTVKHPLQSIATCTLGLWLTACASLPSEVDRPVSKAWANPGETSLGRTVQARQAASGNRADSGFYLLDNAALAFTSRLALIEAAEKTLDIQYYAIHADDTTERLFAALKAAAARGVRIRLLLDDFNTAGKNALVLKLALVPGIEMRLFNPLPGSRNSMIFRVLSSLKDTDRIQRRMHNKILVADNALGITGGRNLGETYFGQGDNTNFVDLDVLAAGRIVLDLSKSFDLYWNNPLAYPALSLVSAQELEALKPPPKAAKISAQAPVASLPPARPALPSTDPLGQNSADLAGPNLTNRTPPTPLGGAANLAELPWIWAPSVMMVDKPSKIAADQEEVQEAQDTLVDGLLQLVSQAQQDLLIVSPYFVPGQRMMEQLADIRRKGVRIRVLTNSLASNDAPAAHVGYARYRKALLTLGIELYEMRAEQEGSLAIFGSSGGSRASLHSKVVIVDTRLVVVGSMNLDLRSKLQNTEIALLIRSPALAREAMKIVEPAMAKGAYRVELIDQQLHWKAPEGSGVKDRNGEPDASPGLKAVLQLIGPFAPEEML